MYRGPLNGEFASQIAEKNRFLFPMFAIILALYLICAGRVH